MMGFGKIEMNAGKTLCNWFHCRKDNTLNGFCLFWLGTPAMTSRGLQESDMQTVSDFLTEAVQITKQIGSKTSQYPSNEGVLYGIFGRL